VNPVAFFLAVLYLGECLGGGDVYKGDIKSLLLSIISGEPGDRLDAYIANRGWLN